MARAATGPMPSAHAAPQEQQQKQQQHGTTAPIPPRDRRSGNRQPLEVLGVITEPNATDKQLEVGVLNVSLHGCAFKSPVAFRPGAIYTMRIGTGPLHLASTLRIISSRDRADGFYDVGAKFV